MAINFPTSLDNFTNPVSGNTLDSPSHSLQHSDINDAVEAMQRKVGVGTAVAGSASAGQVLTISAAGTSTWSTPSPGGLVQIVPTSVAVGSGSGSVDANGAVTFSTASSLSLNDVFSASYDNYRIILTGNLSSNVEVKLRYRVSGADNSTANYNFQRLSGSSTTVSAARTTGATSQDFCIWDANLSSAQLEIFRPFLTEATGSYAIGAADGVTTQNFAGRFSGATSFTGFTIFPTSGTITGSMRVYGYKN